MHSLLQGHRRFQEDVFPAMAERFLSLADGQSPHTLFITCSDSRVDPSLITQTLPGELFVVRNAGNLVPLPGQDDGTAAAIEYAVSVLHVQRVVVCGHRGCGAMGGLIAPTTLSALPTVARWVEHASHTRDVVEHLDGDEAIDAAVRHNASSQLHNLLTHASVGEAVLEGRLALEAWVYDIQSGEVEVLRTQGGGA